MSANLGGVVGGPLPGPLAAVRYVGTGGELILAWRSPTETLIMTADDVAFGAVASRAAADRSAGYLVDQTGGLRAWQLTGARAREVLERIGSAGSIPAPGAASTGRLAELPVLVLSLREGEFVLLVERIYGEHLLGWIDATTADM
jgi:sarcosine oxidase gamma subunit